MKIAVTGSIATDHLMTFPGRFSESLLADKLDKISVSFLVDELQVRRGGVAANIAFGLGYVGLRSILVGSVGSDFADYRSWLERHNVDTESVRLSETLHTARFVCTTDIDQNQIASFYPGAMSEAREIELKPIADRVGGLDLVIIGPNDPEAMQRHTEECRLRGLPFVADPSQQLSFTTGDDIRTLIDGAAYLFSNEYESALIESKTGWTLDDLRERVDVVVTTLGSQGSRVMARGDDVIEVAVPREDRRADPTGVGDAFRAGFIAGLAWDVSLERCAQIGSVLATYVIETTGTQEYQLIYDHFVARVRETYGDAAAEEIGAHLSIAG